MMQIINAAIGCLLMVLSLLHFKADLAAAHGTHLVIMYFLGAVLAYLTLKAEISVPMSRMLAVVTTATMFFYFAGFFTLAPELKAYWYKEEQAVGALSLLLAAFAMIPVLSDYSCRLKAECREARRLARKQRAFFSVPQEIENRTT